MFYDYITDDLAGLEQSEAPVPLSCADLQVQYKKQLKRSKNTDLSKALRQAAATKAAALKLQYDACIAGVPGAGVSPVPIAYDGVPMFTPIDTDAEGMPFATDYNTGGSGAGAGSSMLGGWKTWGLVAAVGLGAWFLLRRKKG